MKRKFRFYLFLSLSAIAASSCKKTEQPLVTSSTLTIVNTVNGSGGLVTNFDGNHVLSYYKAAAVIDSGSYRQFSGYFGKLPLLLVGAGDTTKQILRADLNILPGSIQTLFVTGDAGKPDTLLTRDQVPVYQLADSLAGVRFVNLCPGPGGLSVALAGSNGKVIARELSYKHYTGFQSFDIRKNIPATHNYVFEFRDSASGVLVATYTLNQLSSLLQKNVTLVISEAGNGSREILLVNNYLLDLYGA